MDLHPLISTTEFTLYIHHDYSVTVVPREQLDPTEKVVFQAIQMALIAVLSEVQQQQKNCLLNFGQNCPVNQQGAIHKWRRSLVGGEVSKIGQNCWQIVLKKRWILGRGCQKSGKIADIVYGWPLNFDTANCCKNDFNAKQRPERLHLTVGNLEYDVIPSKPGQVTYFFSLFY